MDFSGLPAGAPRVLDAKAKWSKNSAEYKGTKSVLADVAPETRAKLQRIYDEGHARTGDAQLDRLRCMHCGRHEHFLFACPELQFMSKADRCAGGFPCLFLIAACMRPSARACALQTRHSAWGPAQGVS